MNLDSKPRRKTDYRLEQLDGEMVLYHPSETKILYFNQTASLIWQLCDGERTVRRDDPFVKRVLSGICRRDRHGCAYRRSNSSRNKAASSWFEQYYTSREIMVNYFGAHCAIR